MAVMSDITLWFLHEWAYGIWPAQLRQHCQETGRQPDGAKRWFGQMRPPLVSFLAGWAVWMSVIQSAGAQVSATEEVTTFHQYYSLSREQALKGQPVRITGVVLSYDAEWGQLYIHDGSETVYFSPKNFRAQLEAGQSVQITGTTAYLDGSPAFTNLDLVILGPGTLPKGKRLELAQLASDVGQWIETSGRVRVAETSWGRLSLLLYENGQNCVVYVLGPPSTNDFKRLLGCQVSIRGINASKSANGRLDLASVFVPGFNEVTILEPSTANPLQVPVISIGTLLNRPLGSWTNSPVHLNGLISAYQPGHHLVVKDSTGVLRAQVTQVTQAKLDERVDLWGFLLVSSNEAVLKDAYFEIAQSSTRNLSNPSARETFPKATSFPATPMQVSDIITMSSQEVSQHTPVRLRGVITYADSEWRNGFIQDESGGMYFDLAQKDVLPGQWVELTGQTGPGGFAPEVLNVSIQVLGTTNLPTPTKVDLEDLADGSLDAHWIELDGVVRRVNAETGHLTLSLMSRKGRFAAVIPNFNQPLPTHLIDALVSVRGACSSAFNFRHQLSGITLHVPSLDQVKVLEPGPANPFAIETTKIDAVATFDPNRLAGRRVKVSGVVTLAIPDQSFFLQDPSGGIRAYTQLTNEVQAGDSLEVLGFPALGDYSPHLEEIIFRRTGRASQPVPQKVTAEQVLLYGTNDGLVVSMEARLLQNVPRSANPEVAVQDGPIIFTAHLEMPPNPRKGSDLLSGSLVRLTGVCSIQSGERHEPKTFRLLIGRSEDIELLKTPPWWNARYAFMLVGGLIFLIAAALSWIRLLRRQVRRQTEVIRQKLEAEAALKEKYQELFENSNDFLIVFDLEGKCRSINQAASRFFGWSSQPAAPHRLEDLIAMEDQARIRQQLSPSMTCPAADRFEVQARRGDGKMAVLDFGWRMIQEKGVRTGIQVTARDVTNRKLAEAELKKTQAELLRTSRFAGMAEVATGVLHNVGNVLNSVNVAATLIADKIKNSRISSLAKLDDLLNQHSDDLADFLTRDAKGRQIPSFVKSLSECLQQERAEVLGEVTFLTRNIDHIKEIVAMQQNYAQVSGVVESVVPRELVEDALHIHAEAYLRHGVKVIREYGEVPAVSVDKHKVLQILVNLLSNAKYACDADAKEEKCVWVRIEVTENQLRVVVRDNGTGITPENLTKIFQHGFTTREDGHGFGLHNGANIAKELGGSLGAQSAGSGKGSAFTLQLPLSPAVSPPVPSGMATRQPGKFGVDVAAGLPYTLSR